MNVNKKIIAITMAALLGAPVAMADTVDDVFIDDLLGDQTKEQVSATSNHNTGDSSLLFNAEDSLKKAKEKMELEEMRHTLDLKIEIAKKEQDLAKIETADEVKILTEEIVKLHDEIADLEDDLLEVEEEMFQKDRTIQRLRKNEAQLRATVANLQMETVKDEDGLTDVRLTRVSQVGNDKEATLLYGLSVIQRREGESVGDTIKIKRINFDNIVITNGRQDKTIFIIHENIAEGANAQVK